MKNILKYFSPRKILGKIKRELLSRKYRKYDAKLAAHFKRESIDLFHKIAKVFNENDIVYWLEFGSLLGYYRDNDYLSNENDFDFGVYIHEASKVRELLLSEGFELLRFYKDLTDGGIEECYRYGDMHTTFDIYYFSEENNKLLTTGFKPILDMGLKANLGRELPFCVRKMKFPATDFMKIEFKGELVYIPTNTKEHLAAHYGSNFMIPQNHFNNNTANNVVLYDYDERPAVGWMKYGYYDLI